MRPFLTLDNCRNGLLVLTAFLIPFDQNWAKSVMTLAFLLWLPLLADGERRRFLIHNRVVQLATLLLLVMAASLGWSEELDDGINFVNRFAIYIYIPLLIVASSTNRQTISLIIRAFILAMFVNELISYSMLFGLVSRAGHGAFPVMFMHHVPYSVLVAFTILLLGYEIHRSDSRWRTVFYTLFFLTMTGNLVISGGRTGQAVMFFTLFAVILLYSRLTLRSLAIAILLPTLLFSGAYFGYGPFRERINDTVTDIHRAFNQHNFNSSFGNRLASYGLASDILHENSLLIGVGIGDIDSEKNRIIKRDYRGKMVLARWSGHLHSYYIDILVGTGLLGLMALFALLIAIYRLPIVDRELAYIKIITLFTVIIANLPDRMLHQQNTMLFFAFFIGIVLAQSRLEQLRRERVEK